MTIKASDTGDSGVNVSIYQSEIDDAVVVELDTYDTGLSHIRVVINDGTVFNQDVETGESFGDDLHVRVGDLFDADNPPSKIVPGYVLTAEDVEFIRSLYVHPNEPDSKES
jgi:hypothetical protein